MTAESGHAVIVIPAYDPTSALVDLVADLPGLSIIVVNDGSSGACRDVFDRVARQPGVLLLAHAVNIGKGQALKTAFNHFLLNSEADAVGVVTLEAGRYEFELDMLVRATRRGMAIEEIPIHTVYSGAAQSHFSPLRDSVRISFVFLRFAGLSVVTAILDFGVFAFAYGAGRNILAATIAGRLVAGAFNFSVNRTVVFRSHGSLAQEAARYTMLVAALMSVSYGLVTSLVIFVGLSVYAGKLLAEGTLFAASFALQNLLVFVGRRAPS